MILVGLEGRCSKPSRESSVLLFKTNFSRQILRQIPVDIQAIQPGRVGLIDRIVRAIGMRGSPRFAGWA